MSKLIGTQSSKLFQLTTLSVALSALSLTACGGGGVDSLTPQPDIGIVDKDKDKGKGDGGNGSAQVALINIDSIELDKSEVTSEGAKVTVKVVDKNGEPLVGAIVKFTGNGISFVDSNGATLTKDGGIATIDIVPAKGAVSGAYSISATATHESNTATSAELNFLLKAADNINDILADVINLKPIELDPETVTSEGSIVKVQAVGPDGETAIKGAMVTFSGEGIRFANVNGSASNGSVLTGDNGYAEIKVFPAKGAVSGAYSLSATATINGNTAKSNEHNFLLEEITDVAVADVVNIKLLQLDKKTVTSDGANAIIKVEDADRHGIEDAVVTFSSSSLKFANPHSNGVALTGRDGGASVTVYPADGAVSGAYQLSATVTADGVTKTASYNFLLEVAEGDVDALELVNIDGDITLDTDEVTKDGATATVRVIDEKGNAIENGALVTFSGEGIKFGSPNGRVLTKDGIATIKIFPADGAVSGAYTLSATANHKGNSAKSSDLNFYVKVAEEKEDALNILNFKDIKLDPAIVTSEGAEVTVKLADGNDESEGIDGALVTFAGKGIKFGNSNGRVLTEDGVAKIKVFPADGAVNGAYSLSATARFNGNSAKSADLNFVLKVAEGNEDALDVLNLQGIKFISGSRELTEAGDKVTVTLVNKDGDPVPNALVKFSGAGIRFASPNGSVLTNDQGIAEVDVFPAEGVTGGAYRLSATAAHEGNSAKSGDFNFEVNATETVDLTKITDIVITDIQLMKKDDSLVDNNYLPMDGGRLKVRVIDPKKKAANLPGVGVAGALVTFKGEAVKFSSSNNKMLTDEDGYVSIGIDPISTSNTGAYTLEVKAEYENLKASSGKYFFKLQALDTKLADMRISPERPISAGGEATVSLKTNDSNGNYRNGVTVNFSVDCGTFSESSVISSNQGDVSTNYVAIDENTGNLCEGTKIITAETTTGESLSKSIEIEKADADSIIYETPGVVEMGVMQSGASNSGQIKFVVYANKHPVANKIVRIVKDESSQSDLAIGKLDNFDPIIMESNTKGEVIVNLYPGSISGPVEIRAELLDAESKQDVTEDTEIKASAVSKNVVVAKGRATQERFSVALSKNVLQRQLDGDSTTITASVADRWGNPVAENTIVSFTAEGGKIDSYCPTDARGVCSVTFTVRNPRPADGRVSVVAYVEGDKSYVDKNENNKYDQGEPLGWWGKYAGQPDSEKKFHYTNIGDFFRDDNENNIYDKDLGERLYKKDGGDVECASLTFYQPNTVYGDHKCNNKLSATLRYQFIIGFAKNTPLLLSSPVVVSSVAGGGRLPNELPISETVGDGYSFWMYGNSEQTMYMPSGTRLSIKAVDNTSYKPIVNKTIDNGMTTLVVMGAIPDSVATVVVDGASYVLPTDSNGTAQKVIKGEIRGEASVSVPNKTCSAKLRGISPVAELMPLMPLSASGNAGLDRNAAKYTFTTKDCEVSDQVEITVDAPGKKSSRLITLIKK